MPERRRVVLHFAGVDSAFFAWINGHLVRTVEGRGRFSHLDRPSLANNNAFLRAVGSMSVLDGQPPIYADEDTVERALVRDPAESYDSL